MRGLGVSQSLDHVSVRHQTTLQPLSTTAAVIRTMIRIVLVVACLPHLTGEIFHYVHQVP